MEGGQGNVVQGPLPQGSGLKLPTDKSPSKCFGQAAGSWPLLAGPDNQDWNKGQGTLEQPSEVQAGLEDRLDPRLGQGVATTGNTIF